MDSSSVIAVFLLLPQLQLTRVYTNLINLEHYARISHYLRVGSRVPRSSVTPAQNMPTYDRQRGGDY